MDTTHKISWQGGEGNSPMGASYGKMMMWFFIFSDALTFSGFLASYGFTRYKLIETWPIADEVFNHFPFVHGVEAPMYYVALMTFILIFSSVTMVLAVDAGHQMQRKKVITYMFLTIIGGIAFLGSQAWEWKNFIKGSHGAVQLNDAKIVQFVNIKTGHRVALQDFVHADHDRTQHTRHNGLWFESEGTIPTYTIEEVRHAFEKHPELTIRLQKIIPSTKENSPLYKRHQADFKDIQVLNKDAVGEKVIVSRADARTFLARGKRVVEGANLKVNEYGNTMFADLFFFITGFHGFHVFTGIVLNIIIFFNVIIGTYEKRGHYEMVEKVGLYWHFVDLVWVFVFTFFYLV